MTYTAPQLDAARLGLLVLRVEPQPRTPLFRIDGDASGLWYEGPSRSGAVRGEIVGRHWTPPHQPGDRIPLCELCKGTGRVKAYRGEPSQGYEIVPCDSCNGKGGTFVVESREAQQADDAYVAFGGKGFEQTWDGGVFDALYDASRGDDSTWLWLLRGRWEASDGE